MKCGTYNKETHKSSMCDKCGKDVGKKNLKPIPFLYKDKNDLVHPSVPGYPDYHQYFVCSYCLKHEEEIIRRRNDQKK